MKNYKSKTVKTEGPRDFQQQSKGKNDWIFHSVLKNNKKPTTPLRFADFINKKDKDVGSTNDRDSFGSNAEKINNLSISKAISRYVETQMCLRMSQGKKNLVKRSRKIIDNCLLKSHHLLSTTKCRILSKNFHLKEQAIDYIC